MVAPPGSDVDSEVLRAHALSVTRHGSPALAEVSLAIEDGEILAVRGPRGSGKTTLLRCLSGQLVPDQGEVWFRGTGVHTLSQAGRERLRRERFGWVGPRPDLLPELTAWENAALPLLLSGTPYRTARTTALKWLGHLDVAGCARKRPNGLTLTQRQRVAVARALVCGPSVVFADEPTAPLHHADHDHVLRTLMTVARARGTTVVLSTSDPQTTALADRTVDLLDGRNAGHLGHGVGTEGEAACSLSV